MEIVTKEYILEKLRGIIEDKEVVTKDKLSAIKMCGEHLKMFNSDRHVSIDVRGLVAQMTDADLRKLYGTTATQLEDGSYGYNPNGLPSNGSIQCGLQLPGDVEPRTQSIQSGNRGLDPSQGKRKRHRMVERKQPPDPGNREGDQPETGPPHHE